MKLTTIVFVSALAMAPTLVLAQTGGNPSSARVPDRAEMTQKNSGADGARTTGEVRGSSRSTGYAINPSTGVPQDKPNLSNSPESSDTSQRVK